MVLQIRKFNDPILRRKVLVIKEITQEIKNLSQDMIETMIECNGFGLAAPQVGQSLRLTVIQTEKDPVILINPEILKKSKETEVMEEGCLSFPGIWLKIRRAKNVEVKALDINGNKVQIEAGGLLARVFQHEIDHLNGILFVDKINFLNKLKIKNQLRKIKHFKK